MNTECSSGKSKFYELTAARVLPGLRWLFACASLEYSALGKSPKSPAGALPTFCYSRSTLHRHRVACKPRLDRHCRRKPSGHESTCRSSPDRHQGNRPANTLVPDYFEVLEATTRRRHRPHKSKLAG